MSKINITIFSKNKKTLQNFLIFLKQKLPILKLNTITKYNTKKNQHKKITILKSTHINKTAQERYEYKTYVLNVKTNTFKPFKYLLFFKKLKNNSFPTIKIKIESTIKNKRLNIKTNYLNLKNYQLKLNIIKNLQQWESKKCKNKKKINHLNLYSNLTEKTLNYLKITDCFGEFQINKNNN